MSPIQQNDGTGVGIDPIERVFQAISLTRAGRHEESRRIYDEYHCSSRFGVDVDLSIMLMLLDGLRIFYEQHDTQAAVKRIESARAIAQASVGCKVIDHVAVWLAHCQFNIGQYSEMKSSIELALAKDGLAKDRTSLRLFLTIGDGHCLVGDFDGAREMYERARRIANKIGDALSIAAIVHNRSTMALSHARFFAATGEALSNDYQTFLLELESAENLENHLRVTTVLEPYDVWKPLMRMVRDDFEPAESSLKLLLQDTSWSMTEPMRLSLSADLAYANFRLGNNSAALEIVREVISNDFDKILRAEDRAIVYSYAAQIYSAAGILEQAMVFKEMMIEAKDEFVAETKELQAILSDIRVALARRSVN
ncbi:MAG TPA: hypothetical protein PKA84_05780 [Rubrivivax sp.]|jgi:tetratricopeptide (TPR) repeat protein|nr:hypothetical protein [Rubrivivax sp.]HMR69728.1 hypothetical protein [Rubrivivax sp.]